MTGTGRSGFTKRITVILTVCALILSGCGSWMTGSYSSVTKHKVNQQPEDPSIQSVKDYAQLKKALESILDAGAVEGVFSVEDYYSSALEYSMALAVDDLLANHPIGAYAVESITYEQGTTGSGSAVAVQVTYSRNPDEIANIIAVTDMEQAKQQIAQALENVEAGVVLRVEDFQETDFVQAVESFALDNPDLVMESPQVTASVYPQSGQERVVDVRFAYQTNRESLRVMQEYVEPVFRSAALYVSSEEESMGVKYARLYTFLMERNDYQVKTSLTPAYSLLRHGVGDNRAFAVVYAAMCRRAGLACMVVSGTCQAEPRFWNIICEDGVYYHVDLLRPEGYIRCTDSQMDGYVWDYSAYPACGIAQSEVTE